MNEAAYDLGRDAGECGMSAATNPFDDEMQPEAYEAWISGWLDSKELYDKAYDDAGC